jgi:hypothetical protein
LRFAKLLPDIFPARPSDHNYINKNCAKKFSTPPFKNRIPLLYSEFRKKLFVHLRILVSIFKEELAFFSLLTRKKHLCNDTFLTTNNINLKP